VDLEQIVQQILVSRRDLSRNDVLKKIYEKKRSAEDYFLDEVAARIVAAELGVEIQGENEAFSGEISIKDLVSGLNDVTIVARVIAVYPVQTFSRSDLTEGKVMRMLLADGTGTLKLVLWDDKIELIEAGKMQQGQIIRVLHGYVRESFDGKLELHLGKKGDLEISPKDVDESRLPHTADVMDKIGQLAPEKKRTNVQGLVTQAFPVSEFTRKDGTGGKVRRLRLRDETGEATLVFWNEKVNEFETVGEGDQLRITNARVKKGLDGRIELHVESFSQIEKTAAKTAPTITANETVHRIADLKTEGGPFNINATIASAPIAREVTTSRGEKVLLTTFDLADDTGKIGVTMWRKQAELTRDLAVGTQIKIRNIHVKRGFSNLLELASRSSTTIEIISKPETLPTENKVE